MDESHIKLIAAIITLLASAAGGGVVAQKMYAEQIRDLSAQSEERLIRWQDAQAKLEQSARENTELMAAHNELKTRFSSLEEDYRKATTSQGIIHEIPFLDSDWHSAEVATGDRLRFKLSSASLYLRVVRITDKGPVVQATGLKPFLTDPVELSETDGQFAYLLPTGIELHLRVSPRGSDDGYLNADLSDLEDIFVSSTAHDVKTQHASLKFRKIFVGE